MTDKLENEIEIEEKDFCDKCEIDLVECRCYENEINFCVDCKTEIYGGSRCLSCEYDYNDYELQNID